MVPYNGWRAIVWKVEVPYAFPADPDEDAVSTACIAQGFKFKNMESGQFGDLNL